MSPTNPIWRRHDAHLWIRHDAYRFMAPDPNAYTSYATRLLAQRREEEKQAELAAEQDAFEREVLALRREFASLKLEYELRRFHRKYGYNPDQPRVPAGNPDGGQWTDGGRWTGGTRVASLNDPKVISDAPSPGISDQSPGKIRLASRLWKERVGAIFGQRDLFEGVGPGSGGAERRCCKRSSIASALQTGRTNGGDSAKSRERRHSLNQRERRTGT